MGSTLLFTAVCNINPEDDHNNLLRVYGLFAKPQSTEQISQRKF